MLPIAFALPWSAEQNKVSCQPLYARTHTHTHISLFLYAYIARSSLECSKWDRFPKIPLDDDDTPKTYPLLVTYHSIQVVKAIDKRSFLGELLTKGIRQVVCRIGWNQEHGFSYLGQLNSKRARCGCFTCKMVSMTMLHCPCSCYLPTPPLPPTKIQCKDFWSKTFLRVGSRGWKSSSEMSDMVERVWWWWWWWWA